MAKMMRGDSTEVTACGGLSDCPLDIGFMATPADELVCAPVATDAFGRKKPRPAFSVLRIGIFLGQESR
jgi:hypothetical protein